VDISLSGKDTRMIEKADLLERFLDYLIDPNECIDTYGRTYIDDLEFILAENHRFDFKTQTFPDAEAQRWFEVLRAEFKFADMAALLSFVRSHVDELDLASFRPRSTFHTETLYQDQPTFHKLKEGTPTVEERVDFQRAMGMDGVRSIPSLDDPDPDRYELYMGSDRTNPWTYVLKREMSRGHLRPDDAVISLGNRWIGEISYFRENVGLKKTLGVDLFSNNPELVVAADMHNLPFEDGSIKLVFNRGLINKSYDVRVLVNEVLRVLTDDGMFIVETPGPYDYGVSRLGCTDIKSARNLLRLFEGKVRRIFYIEATKPHRYQADSTKLIRIGFQIAKNGWAGPMQVEPYSPRLFRYYDACRTRYLQRDSRSLASRMSAGYFNALSELLINEKFESLARPFVGVA
jgi:SAM-dependent methyltransferase